MSIPPELEAKGSVEMIRRFGFREFVRQSWHLVEPARPLSMNWAIEAVCDHLEAVTRGQIRKLIINIPPGMGKSTLVSCLWPCWEWTMKPHVRWMFASYREQLSLRDSGRRRDVIISSDWYQQRFGDVFQLIKDNERYFTNDRQGSMFATSTGGVVTGFRAEKLCIDDPHDPEGAESEIQRATTTEWLNLTWPMRMNETKDSAEVLIMQRLHEMDATGLYDKQGGWTKLKIPMEYKGKKFVTSIGWQDPREEIGKLIDENVYSRSYIEDKKKRLGPYGEASQLDQEPSPQEGGIIKAGWINRWTMTPTNHMSIMNGQYQFDPWTCFRFCTVDPAVSDKQIGEKKLSDPDYTAIGAWLVCITHKGPSLCLLDMIHDRLEGPDIVPRIQALHRHWKFAVIGIETVAFQLSLFQQAKRLGLPVREISTRQSDDVIYRIDRDKVSRVMAATPLMADGRFWVPEYSPWLAEYLREMLFFPNAAHDDYVDCTSMACAIAGNVKAAMIRSEREVISKTGDDGINRGHREEDKPMSPIDAWNLPAPNGF